MIYTPIECIDQIKQNEAGTVESTCTKIEFHGYEISVAMHSARPGGNLVRSSIMVFVAGSDMDVTSDFLEEDETELAGDGYTLYRVMAQISTM